MGRPRSETLTEREAQIMEVLWARGAATADQVRESLPGRPHDSTVRTKLRVLEEKGYVRHHLQGRAYVYEPSVEKSSVERTEIKSMLRRFFAGSAEGLLLRLVEDKHVTPAQIARLNRMLDEHNPNDSGADHE